MLVLSGKLRLTTTPLRTRLAAAATRSGVRRLTAPLSSSSPPPPAADGLEQCGELGRRELAGLPHFPLVHAPVLAHGPTGRRPASISFLSCFLSPAESGPLLNLSAR